MNSSLNLQTINQEEALNLSKFYIKIGQNMLICGRRGVGKTALLMQAALDCGYKINYINLSAIERTDLSGYPNLFSNEEIITFKSPYFLPPLIEGQKADRVIIFDEVDKAPQELTAPLLEILQFKKINNKPINSVCSILTSNLANEGAFSNTISSALLDRTAKYILQFEFDKWLNWAKLHNIHDLILGFLCSNPELTCGDIETTQYASPSPRGWTYASEALHQAREQKINDIDTVVNVIAGYVGLDVAMRFKSWFEYYKKFEPDIFTLIEKGESIIQYSELEPTSQLIFCISLCHHAKLKILENNKKRSKYLDNICKFLIEKKVAKEIQLVALHNAFPFELITKLKLNDNKTFFNLVSDLK